MGKLQNYIIIIFLILYSGQSWALEKCDFFTCWDDAVPIEENPVRVGPQAINFLGSVNGRIPNNPPLGTPSFNGIYSESKPAITKFLNGVGEAIAGESSSGWGSAIGDAAGVMSQAGGSAGGQDFGGADSSGLRPTNSNFDSSSGANINSPKLDVAPLDLGGTSTARASGIPTRPEDPRDPSDSDSTNGNVDPFSGEPTGGSRGRSGAGGGGFGGGSSGSKGSSGKGDPGLALEEELPKGRKGNHSVTPPPQVALGSEFDDPFEDDLKSKSQIGGDAASSGKPSASKSIPKKLAALLKNNGDFLKIEM